MIRPYRINVSARVFEALEVLAELEGASCPDEVADLRLGLLLSNEAELRWAIEERKKLRTDFRKNYTERIKAHRATQEAPEPVLPERGAGQSKAHLDDRT